jgi:hypothetical protein
LRTTIDKNKKRCTSCGRKLELSNFHKRSNRFSATSSHCKKCTKDRVSERSLLVHYNITKKDWNEMFEAQNGNCAICGKHQSEFKRIFNVDHDHLTGKVRALLCFKCNTGIGSLNDDIELLEKGIIYLKKHKECLL